ncbi:MAG: hypothetical protein Q9201_000083 [Fulgogasparrea decipioides]
MERPTKRRKVCPRVQDRLKEEVAIVAERPLLHASPLQKRNPLGNQLPLRAPAPKSSDPSIPTVGKDGLDLMYQKRPVSQRLHARNLNFYGPDGDVAEPVVQPVETAVSSFVDVVLESGGTSVGDVLVPAASSVFNLDGYGPVTINEHPPNVTPVPRPSSHTHRHPHPSQQTPQPVPKQPPQVASSSVASQLAPVQQGSMTIQVSGSSSQVIFSSPPTPLPPSPSNSSSTATASDSYFSPSAFQTSSTQTSSASGTTPFQTTSSAFPSPGIIEPTKGNFTTSCKSTQGEH